VVKISSVSGRDRVLVECPSAADRPTRPLPRSPACRAISAARWAGQPGSRGDPADLGGHTFGELDVQVSPPGLVPLPPAQRLGSQ
jgi:hypothetical protein